jgi:hypothetical protein
MTTGHSDNWRPLRSRRNLVILALLVVLGYITFTQVRTPSGEGLSYTLPPSNELDTPKSAAPPQANAPDKALTQTPKWTFDATRDRDNHALTQEQCSATFPDLFHEINRAKEYWKKAQGDKPISFEQINIKWSGDGGMMGMIHNQRV